ncbi:MAG: hypothetical protein M3391_08105 [Actinomycetota bacterium]|nr:hypothetical protein [Actinomycetota bacterium]
MSSDLRPPGDARLEGCVAGAIVPHAPVLLPPVSGAANAERTTEVRAAIAALDLDDIDAIVLLSPHGAQTGVYRATAGSLDAFGLPGIRATHPTDDEIVEELSSAWRRPILDGRVDHGVLVPLLCMCPTVPLVATSLEETRSFARAPMEESAAEGRSFAEALSKLRGLRFAFVASCNTSAGLNARGPLTEVKQAVETEERLVGDLGRGTLPGALAVELGVAGSCAAGTLAAFAAAFAGSSIQLRTHDAPFGVGYLVATAAR